MTRNAQWLLAGGILILSGIWAAPSNAQEPIPTNAKAALAQAQSLNKSKKFGDARLIFMQVAERNAGTTQGLFARFQATKCLFQSGDFAGFKKEGKELLAAYPAADKSLIHMVKLTLGKITYHEGKWDEAATALDEVVQMNPNSSYAAEALALQGESLRRAHRFDEARATFLKMDKIKNTPKSLMEAQHRAAQCLFEKGDYVEFLKESQALLSQNPPVDNHWVQMTRFLMSHVPGKTGNFRESAVQLDAFISAHPTFAQIELTKQRCGYYYMLAADRMTELGNKEEAQVLAQRAKEILDPLRVQLETAMTTNTKMAANYSCRMRILDCYYYQHDYIGMVDAAQNLIDHFQPPSRLWALGKVWMGIALSQKQSPYMELASKHFQDVLDANIVDESTSDPVPTKAAVWRAWVAEDQKDKAGLLAAVDRLKSMPDSPAKQDGLARFAPESK